MRSRVLAIAIIAALIVAGFGWANSYVTLATNDPHAYQPVLIRGFQLLGASQAILAFVIMLGRSRVRLVGMIVFVANLIPLYQSYIRLPYVFA